MTRLRQRIIIFTILAVITVIFLNPFFLKGLIPIPADITVGLYYPWLNQKWGTTAGVPVKNPLMSDIVSIIYQWRILAINSIKNGQFPFWNSSYFLGLPLFANFQTSLVNFTNLVFLLPVTIGQSWGLMIYLQLLFSLSSAYIFLKSFKFSLISSLIGALTFSLSLFSITWLEYGVHNYTAAFLPLMFTVVKKHRLTQNSKYLFYLSILLALQVYGGYPQYAIYSICFCLIYYFYISPIKNLKTIIIFCVFILLGLGLAAPIILPGFELINRSINSIDVTASMSNSGFLPVVNLATFISPNFWGNPATRDYVGQGFYDNNAFYPGIIAALAIIFSILIFFSKHHTPESRFFTVTIIVVLILVVPNPVSVFLKNNLGFIMAKNGLATRLFLLSSLSFSYLSGWLTELLRHPSRILKKVLVATVILIFWQIFLLSFSQKIYAANPVAFKNTAYTFIFSFTLLFIICLSNKLSRFFGLLVFLLLFTELFYYAQKYLPFSPSKYLFPQTPVLDFLQHRVGNYRIATFDTIPENMWTPYGFKTPDGYDTLVPLLNYEYLSYANNGNFPTSAFRASKLVNFYSPLADSVSVKYVLKQSDKPAEIPSELNAKYYQAAFSEGRVGVFENINSLPRARFVKKIINSSSKADTASLFLSTPTDTAIINDQIGFDPNSISSCPSDSSNVNFSQDTDNYISLTAQTDCPRLLILADAWYPGWQAHINGRPTKIYRTNHAVRSIYVPAGQHQITFSYFPSTFKIGLIIMLFSLIFLIWLRKLRSL